MERLFLDFEIAELSEELLDCMGASDRDLPLIRKLSKQFQSGGNDLFTLLDMRMALDSAEASGGYSEGQRKLEACMALYRQPVDTSKWMIDSVAFLDCGMRPIDLEQLGKMVRSGQFQDQNLLDLAQAYQARIPGILEEEGKREHRSCDPSEFRKIHYGLHAYTDLDRALDCANELNHPLLLFLMDGHPETDMPGPNPHFKDLELFRSANREFVVAALFVRDEQPIQRKSRWKKWSLADQPVRHRGDLLRALGLRYFEKDHPPAILILDPDGRMITGRWGRLDQVDIRELLQAGSDAYFEHYR